MRCSPYYEIPLKSKNQTNLVPVDLQEGHMRSILPRSEYQGAWAGPFAWCPIIHSLWLSPILSVLSDYQEWSLWNFTSILSEQRLPLCATFFWVKKTVTHGYQRVCNKVNVNKMKFVQTVPKLFARRRNESQAGPTWQISPELFLLRYK